ncbi:MAG: 50S ribosomal protein L1 [Thermoplasmatota archaeon]
MVEKKDIVKAIEDAVKAAPQRKFPESVELAFNLVNVDLSIPKNRVDEEVVLPKGRGKAVKVGIFASSELAVRSRSVADLVVQPEEIDDLAGDKRKARKVATDHQFFLAEAPLMPTIGRTLGTVLGPRGKMPKPIPPAADPTPVVRALKNTVRVRSRDRKTFHAIIGDAKMSAEDLADNAALVIDRVVKKLERGEQNIGSIYVKTTMGPAQKIVM